MMPVILVITTIAHENVGLYPCILDILFVLYARKPLNVRCDGIQIIIVMVLVEKISGTIFFAIKVVIF